MYGLTGNYQESARRFAARSRILKEIVRLLLRGAPDGALCR